MAETKVFRLGVSLIWLLYFKEEWTGKKKLLQKDRTHYFKYLEFSGIFTINDHISDNSIQINIKFIFTVYEYIIIYQYILLSNVIMKTMCPPGYHHSGFVVTHALGHMMYGYTLLVPKNQRVLNKLSKQHNISGHKWSTTPSDTLPKNHCGDNREDTLFPW